MADTLLKVDNINVYYGNIHAVNDISFEAGWSILLQALSSSSNELIRFSTGPLYA